MGAKYIKFKNIFILCILLIFLVSLSATVASDLNDTDTLKNEGNLTVQSSTAELVTDESNREIMNGGQGSESGQLLASSNDEDVLEDGTYNQLYNKILNGGDYVTLEENYLLTSTVNIYKSNSIIDGQNHIINANGSSRIFWISSSSNNLTFKNIKFINADGTAVVFAHSSSGSASENYTFNFINCTFENNKASNGGTMNAGTLVGTINVINSTFINNTATGQGGCIYINNGLNQHTILNIENSSFTENTASSNAGVLYAYRSVDVYIKSSNFTRNSASNEGGVMRTSGFLVIDGCKFYSNRGSDAGVIFMGQTTETFVYNSYFEDNYAKRWGGVIMGYGFTFESCAFINNHVNLTSNTATSKQTTGRGGAIFSRDGTNVLRYCNFTNNVAQEGGAICIEDRANGLSVTNCIFNDNQATLKGGAIYSSVRSTASVSYSEFNGNSANYGGAIWTSSDDTSYQNGKLVLQNSEFSNNKATVEGGALYLKTSNNEITSVLFKNNNASAGGAIYWNGNAGIIENSNFESNVGVVGSSVYWRSNNGIISNSNFKDNNPNQGSIYWYGSNGEISGSTFNGTNLVYISATASVSLTSNKQTSDSYEGNSIYVEGTASFTLNKFKNAIYNKGYIKSQTYIKTLKNMTIITDVSSLPVFTRIEDDNGNPIKVDDKIDIIYDNGIKLTTVFNNTDYVSSVNNLTIGLHNFTASGYNNSNFNNIQIKNGEILYLVLNLTINQTNYGEKVVFTTVVVNTTLNGTIELSINDVIYPVALINGTAELTLYNMAPNHYEVIASYMEYNQTLHTDIEIDVQLRNSTININANNITYGEVVTVNITATNGTTGIVYIFVDNKMYTVTLKNSTAQLNLTNLAGGVYNVYAVYNGDINFNGNHNNTSFKVTKLNATITIDSTNITVGQTGVIKVYLPSDANGTTYVYIDGVSHIYTKQPITLTVSNLTAGNHTVRVVYNGNVKYNEGTNTSVFTVTRNTFTPIISVKDISVGEIETVTVTVPSNAKGMVLLIVNDNQYYANVNNTQATFTLSGLEYGKYNVTAIYQEDDIYYTSSNNATFNVNYVEMDPVITYSVDDDLNAVVNVTVPNDVTGDIIIEVDGKNYTAPVFKGKFTVPINGLGGGVYPAKLYFANDTKYQAVIKPFEIVLKKIDIVINVIAPPTYVGDNATITVTVPQDAGGNVTIKVNNKTYTQNVVDGAAVFTVSNLPYGTYTVEADYHGDRKYNPDDESETFNVRKVDPNPYSYINVTDIHVGEIATFNITMPSDLTAKINLTIQNKTYTVNVTNGFGQINISGLKYGSPVLVHAFFAGNDKYLDCSRDYTAFSVLRITNYPVNITATTNATSANITVTLPSDANGKGNITIDDRTFEVTYVDGKANITVDGLDSGKTYVVTAHFNGDDKYTEGEAEKTLNSEKTLDYVFEVSANDIFVGQTAYIHIYLPNATNGTVTIRVPGQPHEYIININSSFVDGVLDYPVHDLKAGTYHCSVTYSGDDKYESSVRYGDLLVSRINVSPIINFNATHVGQNLTIQIALPSDANGTINITINNQIYPANVINGSAYVTVPNLVAKKYNATLVYSGDDKYNGRTQHFDVTILKISEYLFDLEVMDIYVGDNETITIRLPTNIDVNVTVTIPGTSYINKEIALTNGIATFNVTDLKAGRYNITASIKDSPIYIDNYMVRYFTVSTIEDYLFNLSDVATVYVRDNLTFILQLPEDANGTVVVNIFDQNFTAEVKNGIANVTVPTTKQGNFLYTISFEEKGKYVYKSQDGYAFVIKKDVELNPIYKESVNVDENITITFKLPSDATGNVSVVSRGVTYTAKLINGTANVTIDGYPLDSAYSPAISYTGDDKYNPNAGTILINVHKVSDYDLNVVVANITVDQNEIINITLPSDVTEDVLISGNFSSNTYSVKLTNGSARFVISDLPAGVYSINVRYQGYQKYEDKSVTNTFTVSKVVPPIAIEFVNNDTIIVKLPFNANGFANVTVGDIIDTQIDIINGVGSLDVFSLRPGNYFVNATFLGGVRYLENNTNVTITIPKIDDYNLPISVEDITVYENATIRITAPEYATGSINITIDDGEIIEVPIVSGVATYNATGLKVGNHTVIASYANDEYVFKTNSTTFNVEKIKTTLNDFITGNATSLTVNVTLTEGVTGNVTIAIDGNAHVFNEIDSNKINLTIPSIPGEHLVIITYSGDENHTDATVTGTFETFKITDYSLTVNATELITVIDNNVITVTIPKGIEGEVFIYINGEAYDEGITVDTNTGKATLTLDTLPSGNYTIRATFSNNVYGYQENTTNFTVIKLNTTINVNVTNITKDLTEVINITLNETATGYININSNGTVFRVEVNDGSAILSRSNLMDGVYSLNITYEGNEIFNPVSTTVNFTVSKIPVNITISGPENIFIGQQADFVIETSRPITDLITVRIGNKNYTAIVYNGRGNLTISDLDIGNNQEVKVIYDGDENYLDAQNVTKINVNDKIPTQVIVKVHNATLGEKVTINVTVISAENGTVTIAMLGNPITQQLENGMTSFTYENLTARDYHFTAYYFENNNYFGSNATGDFTVFKKQSTISINISNSYVGDLDIVNLTVTEGATGNVLISVGDLHVYVQLNGTNKLQINLTEFSIGTYNVTATYTGDDNYYGSTTNTSFNVTKKQTTINITTRDVIVIGYPVVFTIETSANLTEVITIKIVNRDNGEVIITENTFIENGKGSYVIYNLAAGNYTAYAYFPGNTQYDEVDNNTNFTVSGKSPVSLSVEVGNITLGEDAVVYVNVTGALTGKVTLNMAGNPQTKDVVDGKVNFTVPNLLARDYHVTVTYLENDDYLSNSTTTEFTVFRKETVIAATVTNATVGSIEYIEVTVPDGATGTVLLTVEGSKYYGTIENNVAQFNITGLLVGNHTAYIEYMGDSEFNGSKIEANITTAKLKTTIIISCNDSIIIGHPVEFIITTSANFTEVVTIEIDGQNYTSFVETGKGKFTIYDLPAKDYTATVFFPGNTQYDAVKNHTDFTVKGKLPSQVNVTVKNITVDESITVYVNVTDGATGYVSIVAVGEAKVVELKDGKANYTFFNLDARNYHVTVYYVGDDNYLTSNGTADFTVSKIPTSIKFDVKDINVGQKATIEVLLNESTDDEIIVHVNGVKYTVTYYDNTLEIPNLPEGTVVVFAEFEGNNRLDRSSNDTTFKVTKNTTSIHITPHNITAGQKETITINLAHDVNGVLEVTVGNVSYAAVIKNGVATLEISNLVAGDYDVVAIFHGNERYINATGESSFKVSHQTSYLFNANVAVDNDLNVIINVTLPDDVSGNFNVEIDGKNYTGIVLNGVGSVTIPNLPGKEYNGIVYFDGNDKYAPSTAPVEFTINKVVPNMKLDYQTAINVGEDGVITVILPQSATGNVTIYINGTNKTEKVVNGTAKFIISDLEQGTYPFDVNYTGDGRYLASEISGELAVNKLSDHSLHIDAKDIYVGDDAIINVTLPIDATGNVTIFIDGRNFTTDELVNGKGFVTVPNLAKGTHDITAIYNGDGKYGYIEDNSHIIVKKYENYLFNVTIENGTVVGQNATITVTLPSDVNGKVNITVDGETREIEVINGNGNLTVNVTSGGNHTVIVTYPGNEKYEPAEIQTDLSNDKITGYPFSIKGDSIELGQIAEVWYYLPEDAYLDNATVTINVSGRNVFHLVVNENGTGFAPFPNLPIAVYDVIVTYSGNGKYAASTRHTQITVTKVSEYPIYIHTNDPTVGENLTIQITLPSDAGGVVNVTIVTLELGNKTYNVTVINGTANFTIPTDDLEGDYDAIVHYSGDDKYDNITRTVHVDIVKVTGYDFNVTAQNIYVGQNETITVNLPDDVNAILTINIGNDSYDIEIINGTGSRNITGLAYGTYDAEVTFSNFKYDKRTKHASFTVSKVSDYKFNMTYTDAIKVGQNATIEVELPKDAKGNVSVLINNKTFTGEIKDGKSIINATDLPEGLYQFTLTFVDDAGKYSLGTKMGVVVVTKTDIEIIPEYNNITVGEDAVINVTLPAGATGNLTLVIDGLTFTEEIGTDGKVSFTVPDLDADNHTFIIGYDGDDKYNGDVFTGVLKADKVDDYDWDFKVDNIKVGQDEIINITLPDDATGNLIITVGNVSYHAFANGNTSFTVSGLDNGTYKVTIQYQGNGKYINKTLTKEFNVTKNTASISIEVIDDKVIVTLPDDATGEVNITVGNKTELGPIIKGKATLDIDDVLPGDYTINATYDGDRKYFYANATKPLNIPKVDIYDMNVNANNITYGDNATVTVKLPSDINGKVNITIDNRAPQEVEVNEGIATLNVSDLGIGEHAVFANFTGNNKYNNNSASATFNVKGQDVTPEIIVKDNTTVIVKLPDNANGKVNITIGNETQLVDVQNGEAIWNGTNLLPGDYVVVAEYLGDDRYAPVNTTAVVNIPKYDSTVDLNVSDIMEGSIEIITVEVTPGATGIVLITIGNDGYYKELDGGKATFYIAGLTPGFKTATVIYYGDSKYNNSTASKTFRVGEKETPTIIITADKSIEIDNELTFTVTTTSNSTNITVKVNGKEIQLTGDKYVFAADTAGEFNITAVVAENTYYNSASNYSTFTVYKHASAIESIVVPQNTLIVGDNAEIKVTMVNSESGIVLIELGNHNYTVPIEGKTATLNVVLPVGEYTAIVYYPGDDKYNSTASQATAKFRVSDEMKLTVGENDGNKTPITIDVGDNSNGAVVVTINGIDYPATVENGTAIVYVDGNNPSVQEANIVYTPDGENPIVQTTTVDIPKVTDYPLNVSVVDVGKENGSATIKVQAPKDAAGNVTINVGGNPITVPLDENGTAIVTVNDIPVGSHDVDVSYTGDNKYVSKSNRTHVNMPISLPTVNVVDHLVRGWNSQFDYEAVFTNQFGEVLVDTDVTFVVNGKSYTAKTESHGIAKLSETLPVGEYTVTSINPVTGEQVTKKLSIVPRLIYNKDLTMDFVDGSHWDVLVIGDDGNPVSEGEIIDIYVNTIHYVAKTDKNGYAKLKINLNPATYHITAEYKNYKVANTLKVKQTLKLVKKTVTGKKGKKIILKAKLKWSNGKAIKGKKIVFKFRNKSYTAKTNSKGIAKVTIKVKVTKKLKKGKKYTYSAKYLTNLVKGKVKIKK